MYVLRSRLCRKVEVEIRNGAKEAITQEWRVLAMGYSSASRALEVTWCAYVVIVGTFNNSNYYDVIEYVYNVKA